MWIGDWRKNRNKKDYEVVSGSPAESDAQETEAYTPTDLIPNVEDVQAPEAPKNGQDPAPEYDIEDAGTFEGSSDHEDNDDSNDPACGEAPAGAEADHDSNESDRDGDRDAGRAESAAARAQQERDEAAERAEEREQERAREERQAAADAERQAEHERQMIAAWREELAHIGGRNPLLHFVDKPDTRIDLTTTHPGGLAQFITGQKILLSNLIRDDLALRHARISAGKVTDKAQEMRTVRGLSTVHMGAGIATWTFEGEQFTAPVLLRPLAIRRFGTDFELKLKKLVTVNPELIHALREQFGISVDANTLLELSQSEGVFKPQPVIDRLRQMVAGVPDFSVHPRLVVSSFLSVARGMAADTGDMNTTLLRAVRGDKSAISRLKLSYRPVSPVNPDQRSPETDRNLYDADAEQEDVLAQVEAGHSLLVNTMPGTGGTQTVVNAIGGLVRSGKRVLVVSQRQATIDGIAHRLKRVGISGFAASPAKLRRVLVEGIRRNEQPVNLLGGDVDQALVRLRGVLVDYENALTVTDATLGCSPLDALRELAKLSSQDPAPETNIRLDDESLAALSIDRSELADNLVEVARLGQFQYGPEDSPWYGVSFHSTEEARKSFQRAVELSETKVPRLFEIADKLIEHTNLRAFETLHELGIYLNLLAGIRDTLDRFKPEVYDRSLTEVIAAHAPRSSDSMSSANRRRLKKLAREFVRPGVQVDDMYKRLVDIQQQRVLWQRYVQVKGSRPEVPTEMADVLAAFDDVYSDTQHLDEVLGAQAESDKLENMSLGSLVRYLSALAEESDVLHNIQERTAIIDQLRDSGLEPLLEDLSLRHTPKELVAAELELAWWQSALEYLLRNNDSLLSANTGLVERLQSDFRIVDDAHMSGNGAALAAMLADSWRVGLLDHSAEAEALRQQLRTRRPSLSALYREAPHLMASLAPLWAVTPYDVPQLPAELTFDTVLLVDAAAMSMAEVLGAVRRGKQVVAFGDPVIQQPQPFEIGVNDEEPSWPGAAPESAYEALERVLPELRLTHSYRAGGADLTELVNNRFYDGQIHSLPWAGTYLGHRSITYEFVRAGQGLPDEETGAVEATDAEVDRVVQRVVQHAEELPRESLMVVTASARHAVKVRQAVYQAFSTRRDLSEFLLGERAEPFVVGTIEETAALSRDRVIFSLGYGRTPHGRVLSNFGTLSRPGGERLVAVAMTRARRGMVIISCFRREHLGNAHLRYGVAELAEVFDIENPEPAPAELPAEQDPMLAELADRLTKLGLVVELNHAGEIPLVASLGVKAIAVDLDFGGGETSLRHALRLRPAVLRRLGWHYHRVQSFDLFADPAHVALRIARLIGYREHGELPAEDADASANESDADQLTGSVNETGPLAEGEQRLSDD